MFSLETRRILPFITLSAIFKKWIFTVFFDIRLVGENLGYIFILKLYFYISAMERVRFKKF